MRQYLAIGLTVSALLVVALIGMNYQMFGYAGICVPEDKQRRSVAFAELEREVAKMRDDTWVAPAFGYRNAYFNLAKSLCPSVITKQNRHEAEKLGPPRQMRIFWGDNQVEVKITVEADSVLANDVALARSVSSDLETEFTGQFEMDESPVTIRYFFADGGMFSEPLELASENDVESGDTIIESSRRIVNNNHEIDGDKDLSYCPTIYLNPPSLDVPSTVETVESIRTMMTKGGPELALDEREQGLIKMYGSDAWWRWQLEFEARLTIAQRISSTVTEGPIDALDLDAFSIRLHVDPFSIDIEKTFCMTNSIFDDQKKTLAIHAWLKAEP